MKRAALLLVAFLPLAAAVRVAPAAPAPAPTRKADFPASGRSITMIVPFGAGGPTDVAARLLVPPLEKDLATTVTVTNKPGASTQIGITQIAGSKPDGYTVGFVSLPQVITIYLDPDRKSVFTRKDLQPLAMHVFDAMVLVVRADSPYKSTQQLLDAAKANPQKIKSATGGFMGTPHLAWLEMERITGARFALVHFEGSAPGITAVLGGHVDAMIDTVGGVFSRARSGEVRVLGLMDSQENQYLPGVKTMESQGLKLRFAASRGLVAPAGTPREVVGVLTASIQKAINGAEHKKKMDEMGQTLRYMDPAEFEAYWADMEKQVRPLMDQAKATAAR